MNYIKIFLIVFLQFGISLCAQSQFSITSPDQNIKVDVNISDKIFYTVSAYNQEIILPSEIGITIDGLDNNWLVKVIRQFPYSEILKPTVWQKSSTIENKYNVLSIEFLNDLVLVWRVFDNGVAWQWQIKANGKYLVLDEKANFNFGVDSKSWYPQEDSFYSHNERAYHEYAVGEIKEDMLASLPVLFEVKETKVLLTESSLFDYAGMWVRGNEKGGVQAVFPQYPKEKEIKSDRDEVVTEREPFIAKTGGVRSFPWRVLMIEREDKGLITNQLVYQLAKPAEQDFSWVRPGKVSWDWWNANNIYGVDFRAGINTETYKYYINFAAEYDIEYVILDEGWSDTRDLSKISPEIDMEELSSYAREKQVGLILWVTWLSLDQSLEASLDQFARWGVKGIKVDFMQRDDQDMVNYYERVAKAAADRKMLVDFHGAYKPTGWLRTYPNILTSEGVLGNEISKFAGTITPEHTTTLPFIRMAAGPMDFTPGGMLNAQKDAWRAVATEPMTMGTRCNQLAMYVIYESPLQMLCDLPTHYYEEPECMELLRSVPVEWEMTVPLQAKIGDYVMVARKAKNGDWYLGAMTDWTPRQLEVPLSFLDSGKYTMHIWKDGVNADRNAKDFSQDITEVEASTTIKINMAPGGGWVAVIRQK